MGFFVSYGGCHTHASWFIRTRPNVKNAFAAIWNTQSLVTSFDTFISWRPWWNQEQSNWHPYVENLHVDQNPYHKRGFHCVQGMVPLVDVEKDGVGGLMVVPKTNNDQFQEELCERYKQVKGSRCDWVEFSHKDPNLGKGVLVECKAGDLILWDSRTAHGGKINQPTEEYKAKHSNELVRLAMTVTMQPRKENGQMMRERRLAAFKKQIGLTHWPNEYNTSSFGVMTPNIHREKIEYKWPTLTS